MTRGHCRWGVSPISWMSSSRMFRVECLWVENLWVGRLGTLQCAHTRLIDCTFSWQEYRWLPLVFDKRFMYQRHADQQQERSLCRSLCRVHLGHSAKHSEFPDLPMGSSHYTLRQTDRGLRTPSTNQYGSSREPPSYYWQTAVSTQPVQLNYWVRRPANWQF